MQDVIGMLQPIHVARLSSRRLRFGRLGPIPASMRHVQVAQRARQRSHIRQGLLPPPEGHRNGRRHGRDDGERQQNPIHDTAIERIFVIRAVVRHDGHGDAQRDGEQRLQADEVEDEHEHGRVPVHKEALDEAASASRLQSLPKVDLFLFDPLALHGEKRCLLRSRAFFDDVVSPFLHSIIIIIVAVAFAVVAFRLFHAIQSISVLCL
mmetsp:Transcript_23281/g.65963  ORF Transcript_23281/g.65963 Transcript_23281/m.65963 type:complete len:208 (+) Transcript_23281:837-1460(+)